MVFCRKAGYRLELAWSCCVYAGMLKEPYGEGDRVKAMRRLDESPVLSSELGTRPLMEWVLSRREILRALKYQIPRSDHAADSNFHNDPLTG